MSASSPVQTERERFEALAELAEQERTNSNIPSNKFKQFDDPDLLLIERALRQAALHTARQSEAVAWRCFHCDETFTDKVCAADHFGYTEASEPACRINLGPERSLLTALRRTEDDNAHAWRLIHDEASDATKAHSAQAARHGQQLIAAEELGYSRGLADAAKHPPTAHQSQEKQAEHPDRACDRSYRAGFNTGWNAGLRGDEKARESVNNRVGTNAEYGPLPSTSGPAVGGAVRPYRKRGKDRRVINTPDWLLGEYKDRRTATRDRRKDTK